MNNKPYVTIDTLEVKAREWLEKVAPYNQQDMKLNFSKSALLVIDMQNFFLDPKSPAFTCGGLAVLLNVKKLINAFREKKLPVIYTRHVHHPGGIDAGIMKWWWDGMCIEGTTESEIHPDIAPMPDEKIIDKHRYSAFYNTDLETILRCLKIEDIVISGVMTNMCCESTARDAYYRDYRVFFPADATGTINEVMHFASLLNLGYGFAKITSTNVILQ
ncbi:MAG TPA: isochorismatase family cysteine hydrolase [Ignavibacteria bacterium]|nr:isochorismatase family cysteine hydrolase [Ignavibacteria bacterium]